MMAMHSLVVVVIRKVVWMDRSKRLKEKKESWGERWISKWVEWWVVWV